MGGATTIVEATIAGRRAIGSDINELAIFVALAKTSRLSDDDKQTISAWARKVVPAIRCNVACTEEAILRNMTLPEVRWLRKLISLLLRSGDTALPSETSRRFCRCVILNVSQWALNGRKRIPAVGEFRQRVTRTTLEMLAAATELERAIDTSSVPTYQPVLRKNDAERIDEDIVLKELEPVDLVVTSPPYPGIHLLYHRWQVDGRKETDAPYWIAACQDGAGSAYYNFADRRRAAEARYFQKAEHSFGAVRNLMKRGAHLVQLVAFSERKRQLPRYLGMLERAGFAECHEHGHSRVWRDVPGRRWYATFKGALPSSKEVLLIHQAV